MPQFAVYRPESIKLFILEIMHARQEQAHRECGQQDQEPRENKRGNLHLALDNAFGGQEQQNERQNTHPYDPQPMYCCYLMHCLHQYTNYLLLKSACEV